MDKQKALSKPPRYYWKRCYGMPGGNKHWALCDTHSDALEVPIVSDFHMVLLYNAKKCLDGRPLGKQPLPELIVKLLNEHFSKPNNGIVRR